MRKVCYHYNWIGNCGKETCVSNGITCVFLTSTEKVVCWHTGYESECDKNPCCTSIDGSDVVIKDRNQTLYRLDGKELQKRDRHDSMWQCRLRNDPFELGKSFSPLNFSDSALIIMDMWDKHPGPGSSLRASQLASPINDFACFLRKRGCLIIHSPSERGVYDVNNPLITENERQARLNAINAHYRTSRKEMLSGFRDCGKLEIEWERKRFFYLGSKNESETFDHIVENSGKEWPMEKNSHTGQPIYQNPSIKVEKEDAISATMLDFSTSDKDAYPELLALTEGRPNLIYCGIHTNMCILARPNSMRVAAKAGKSLWIVRDLTDACLGQNTTGLTKNAAKIDGSGNMYRNLNLNHFEGTDLVVDWIGRNVGAETWTSDVVTSLPRFRFYGPYGDDPERVWPRPEENENPENSGGCC